MRVAVVALVDEHNRWLCPLRERFATYILSTGRETHIFLATEKLGEVVMKPAASVIARIHNHSVAVAVLAKQTVVDLTETRAVHSLYMDISYTAARHAVDHSRVAFHPTLVEKLRIVAIAYRLHIHRFLLAVGLAHVKLHLLSGLAFKEWEIILAGCNQRIVDSQNYVAVFDTERYRRQRTALDDFGYLQAVAIVGFVVEGSEGGGRHSCSGTIVTASGVRRVQLAKYLAEQYGEVVIVVDIREELGILLFVLGPVDTVQIDIIEFVKHLTPHVVVDIFAFVGRTTGIVGLEIDAFLASVAERHLLNAGRSHYEQILSIFVGNHVPCAQTFCKDTRVAHFKISLIKATSVRTRSHIVELVALRSKEIRTHARRRFCQTRHTVTTVLKVEFQRLHIVLVGLLFVVFFLLIFLFVFFILVGLLGFLLSLGFGLLGKLQLLFSHVEFIEGIAVEEHHHNVAFIAPASVALVAVLASGISHALSVHHPLGSAVAVTALRQIHYFSAVGLHKGYVGIVPTTYSDVVNQNPAAVGTPFKTYVAVGIAIIELSVKSRSDLFRLKVKHPQSRAVLQKRHFLAVGAVVGLESRFVAFVQRFFYQFGSVKKRLFFRVFYFGGKQLPDTVALAVVDDRTSVGSEIHHSLLSRSIRDTTGGVIFRGSDIYVAAEHKGHHLSVGRHGHGCRA